MKVLLLRNVLHTVNRAYVVNVLQSIARPSPRHPQITEKHILRRKSLRIRLHYSSRIVPRQSMRIRKPRNYIEQVEPWDRVGRWQREGTGSDCDPDSGLQHAVLVPLLGQGCKSAGGGRDWGGGKHGVEALRTPDSDNIKCRIVVDWRVEPVVVDERDIPYRRPRALHMVPDRHRRYRPRYRRPEPTPSTIPRPPIPPRAPALKVSHPDCANKHKVVCAEVPQLPHIRAQMCICAQVHRVILGPYALPLPHPTPAHQH